jgi:hypothetical protein
MAQIHFLTFADGSPQLRGAAWRLSRQAHSARIFATVHAYGLPRLRAEYPDFWTAHNRFLLSEKRGLGYFLWKPFLIAAKLGEIAENDFLVYCDAGCEIAPRYAADILDMLPTEPDAELAAVPLEPFHTTARWTHSFCLNQFAEAETYLDYPQIGATFMLLRNTRRAQRFSERWLELSTIANYGCIRDRPGDTQRPEFQDHRWDQSVFSLLAYECERRGELRLKLLPIDKTRKATAGIHGIRNKTPFTAIGRGARARPLLNRTLNVAVKLFWNENRYRARLISVRAPPVSSDWPSPASP